MLCHQFAEATSKFRCGAIQKRGGARDFVKGSSNFNISLVRDHEDSSGYGYVRELKTAQDDKAAGRVVQTPAGEALKQLICNVIWKGAPMQHVAQCTCNCCQQK